jgi:hypothetical protein
MRTLAIAGLFAGALTAAYPPPAAAQEVSEFLAVGAPAPDIQVTGATRYGVLSEPVRLSSLRGETVVLAFFFRARTPG